MTDDHTTTARERRRAEREEMAARRSATKARKAEETKLAKDALASGLRHYESDYIAIKNIVMTPTVLRTTANGWVAKGFRVVQMVEHRDHIVLLLEHHNCDCDLGLR